MNKKLILSLGTATAVAPVAVVVSCGINQDVTTEEQKLYRNLTSDVTLRILENQWQYKVLASGNLIKEYKIASIDENGKVDPTNSKNVMSPNFDDAAVRAIAIAMLQKEINKDPEYLNKLSLSLLNSGATKSSKLIPGMFNDPEVNNVYTKTTLNDWGLMQSPLFANDIKFDLDPNNPNPGGLTTDGLKLLLADDRLEFKNNLLQNLVVYQYLTNVKREDWAKVFVNQNTNINSAYRGYIDDDQFIVVREALAKRYFGKWSISLNKEKSNRFNTAAKSELTVTKAFDNLKTLNDKDYLSGNINYSDSKSTITNNVFDFDAFVQGGHYNSLVSFKGINTQSNGPGILSFSADQLKQAKTSGDYTGFVTNKEFIKFDFTKKVPSETEKKVPLFADRSETANLTFVSGIMPSFNNQNKFAFGNKEQIVRFFAAFDDSLYADAKKYYLTKTDSKPAIILKFKDNSAVNNYKEILENKFNIDFLEEKDPE